jgi:hypothetical protein
MSFAIDEAVLQSQRPESRREILVRGNLMVDILKS